jgi:hypothetical protein
MIKAIHIPMRLSGAVLLGGLALATSAHAESASATWAGPNGGAVEWHGHGSPGHYRGAVTMRTPDGRVYRRVTRARRGPDGAFVSRKWVGPNGAVFGRKGWIRR